MSVGSLVREPCPSVSNSRLIIPFLVVFFQFYHLLGLFEPGFATVTEIDSRKTITAEF